MDGAMTNNRNFSQQLQLPQANQVLNSDLVKEVNAKVEVGFSSPPITSLLAERGNCKRLKGSGDKELGL
ncbi:MAG: hypothetical protein ACJAZX_000826 [Rickettsiales bacterium]|jgi:hypothetical protein